MNHYHLIDSFFIDPNDYITFLVGLKERTIANREGTCFATLQDDGIGYVYQLIWLEDGRFIGDYVKPFRATQENIDLFNLGCKIIAERMAIYLDTNDPGQIPDTPPAFGVLTDFR